MTVRTRFAPSPTGYLHIGGARTALFAWAFARHHGGQFILRIEDTDLERSTPQATQAILDGMRWLGLDYDEGPYFQTQRSARYAELIAALCAAGHAYPCYASKSELDTLRAEQEARGEKPRYDGRWRPEPGKTLPVPPRDGAPVIRFRNPADGETSWDDLVKGTIRVANRELDDFIIARADGSPTYNFCVVVDDRDMGITHVIRGDDHVNNTPRQINLLRALAAPLPHYAHLSMILGEDGQKLSKRRNSVAVTDYAAQGYLPDALINYLARLGWSHGDDEFFSRAQLIEWFDLNHITPSAAQFNTEKLKWLNACYIRQADDAWLADEVCQRITPPPDAAAKPQILALAQRLVPLFKDRADTLNALADAMSPLLLPQPAAAALWAAHCPPTSAAALIALRTDLHALAAAQWQDKAVLANALKQVCGAHQLKMPQLAIPLRLALFGQTHSPAIDAVLVALGRTETLQRLDAFDGRGL